MRNPYNKYYYDFDELCVVRNRLELQVVINFMIAWDIDCQAFDFDRGLLGCKSVMIAKGDLNQVDLKEARDGLSGVLYALRIGMTSEAQESLRKRGF